MSKQQASGAFMQIGADRDSRLIAARSPAAKMVELHEMVMNGDEMTMRQMAGLDIVPGRVRRHGPDRTRQSSG